MNYLFDSLIEIHKPMGSEHWDPVRTTRFATDDKNARDGGVVAVGNPTKGRYRDSRKFLLAMIKIVDS